MKIIAILFISVCMSVSFAYASETKPTICRSFVDENKFREIAGPNIEVLAVCPKKGIYFIEIQAEEKELLRFKEAIFRSDQRVFEIKKRGTNTSIGSKILMVEFKY